MKKLLRLFPLLLAVLLTSCMTIETVPSSEKGSSGTNRELTLEELTEETETSEELQKLLDETEVAETVETEEKSLSEDVTEPVEEPEESEIVFEEEVIEENTPLETVETVIDDSETIEEIPEEVTFETPVFEGTSILTGSTVTPGSTWQAASESASDITPMAFVSAEELPLEIEGRSFESTNTVAVEEPKITWDEDVTFEPAVAVVSNPVETQKELDILAEYDKFLSELGDDYTLAASEDIEETDLNTLLNLPTEEPPVEEAVETAETAENTDEEENAAWEKVPEEGKTSGIGKFFSDLWKDIKSLFSNLWTTIKGWFSKKE